MTDYTGVEANKTFLAVSVSLTVLTSVFVAARISWSWQQKTRRHMLHIDDYIIIVALCLLSASVAGYNEVILALEDPTSTVDTFMKLSNVSNWIGGLALWACRVPILLLYITLFGVKTWMKVISYCGIVVTGTISLIMCSTIKAGVAVSVVSAITDVLIFVLPISLISRLHLPVHKRIGVAVVFAGGLVAIAASVISAYYKFRSLKWSTSGGIIDMICTIVECAIALMVACVPGAYGLWSHTIVHSGPYSRLSSAVSHVSFTRFRHTTTRASDLSVKSKESRPSTANLEFITSAGMEA